MLKSEILEIIANGESSELEFKRDDIRPEQLAKEIVAFANSFGGRVLLGVEDDGCVSGIKRSDLEPWVMDTVCGRYVHPALIPKYEEALLDKSLRVAVLTIPPGSSKPYVVKHYDREDFYVRVGSVSKLASREQIVRMSASGGILHVETMPVPRTSLRNLDMARLENYFRDILAEPSLPQNDAEWSARLEDMGFLAEHGGLCTIAGLVLFGINPRRYLKQAGLRIMVFDAPEKDYKAVLDTVLDAPLVARVEVSGQRVSGIIDTGLVEKAAAALYPFITEESDSIDKGFRRPPLKRFPWNAIRELILNALAHRDWTRSTDIEICRYDDRLEVISPGALPNSMTVEKMVAGRRTPRNPIIMEVLRDYQYVDARGMGIRTKVIPSMRSFNGTGPLFEATEDQVKTTLLYNGPKSDRSNPSFDPNDPNFTTDDLFNDPDKPVFDPNTPLDRRILTLIGQDPNISYATLAELVGVSKATVKRAISRLKANNLLLRRGSARKGEWEIIHSEG